MIGERDRGEFGVNCGNAPGGRLNFEEIFFLFFLSIVFDFYFENVKI